VSAHVYCAVKYSISYGRNIKENFLRVLMPTKKKVIAQLCNSAAAQKKGGLGVGFMY
jgi:hypothetical protein